MKYLILILALCGQEEVRKNATGFEVYVPPKDHMKPRTEVREIVVPKRHRDKAERRIINPR